MPCKFSKKCVTPLHFISKPLLQGLDLDAHGRLATSNKGMRRADCIAEQEAWAAHSDKKASEWVENMGHLGGKAMDNAGGSPMLSPLS